MTDHLFYALKFKHVLSRRTNCEIDKPSRKRLNICRQVGAFSQTADNSTILVFQSDLIEF